MKNGHAKARSRAQSKPRPQSRRSAARAKWVYLLEQGRAGMRDLLGGKGANLAEMTAVGLPVPPGFILTTRACNSFLEADGHWPKGMWEQTIRALGKIERRTRRKFGNPACPLLVSCRSGAKFSMPGMMDTILNIGLNDAVAAGMLSLTHDARFVYDAYRRLIQMFGTVVLGVSDEPFEKVLAAYRSRRKVVNDAELGADDLLAITAEFKQIVQQFSSQGFPEDPAQQLRLAIEAVFRSWNGKRAFDYRRATGIPHNLGTAVNIVAMVFGNLGNDSGTGVVTTRNVSTGEREMEGDYLTNAQGEDVVAGKRITKPIASLRDENPAVYAQLQKIGYQLERHFRDVQDMEFTIENRKLWMLQTRNAKRTAQAAVRIAVEMAQEKLISRREAVLRVTPEHVDFFLHPQFDPAERIAARERGDRIATGLNVSPGAASGMAVFDADVAEQWALRENKEVIMVRPETKADDVHGMLASRGVLTSHGGRTSHAALVARQFGKPAVVGASAIEVDPEGRCFKVGERVFREGEIISIDGTTGDVFAGRLTTILPDFKDPHLLQLLAWADGFRRLGVWANADYPADAIRARGYGAEGIGLCRTQHMFFESERLPHVQNAILAKTDADRAAALARLLPFQREDFVGLFKAMDGLPVIIRLIDPPLHEFLPNHDELLREVTELETRECLLGGTGASPAPSRALEWKHRLLEAVESMMEHNPMLGLRGVRLAIHLPAFVQMQIRAIFEAACSCAVEGVKVFPKIMIPLVADANELQLERDLLEAVARTIMDERGIRVDYQFGTMIELPRAAITAGQIAQRAEFFSFGTNDLTQTVFGVSRDDAETGFLREYLEKNILTENPFATIDQRGVGAMMELAIELGRRSHPKLEIGICGEHGGDPKSIAFCHRIGLDYVSCSAFRVPIARLAAAHAALDRTRIPPTGRLRLPWPSHRGNRHLPHLRRQGRAI